jgi:hypothetical protein
MRLTDLPRRGAEGLRREPADRVDPRQGFLRGARP